MSREAAEHTYGPECRLAAVPYPAEADEAIRDIPPPAAQFFYSSVIPIDDPLAAAAIPDARTARWTRFPQRPFSQGDNSTLEKAWLSFGSREAQLDHQQALGLRGQGLSPSAVRANMEKLEAISRRLAYRHELKHGRASVGRGAAASISTTTAPTTAPTTAAVTTAHAIATATTAPLMTSPVPTCCAELRLDASEELRKGFCALARRRQPGLNRDAVVEAVMGRLKAIQTGNTVVGPAVATGTMVASAAIPIRPPAADDGITGMPFVRVKTLDTANSPTPMSSLTVGGGKGSIGVETKPSKMEAEAPADRSRALDSVSQLVEDSRKGGAGCVPVDVPVGVSRLHMVSLPALQMRPIYWSPVNDITVVLRATWFYRDTMAPVEPVVANQLEAGYRELRPWSETWSDEIRCAIEVGALGEEKVSHALWPKLGLAGPPGPGIMTSGLPPWEPLLPSDPSCAARCFGGAAAAEGSLNSKRRLGGDADGHGGGDGDGNGDGDGYAGADADGFGFGLGDADDDGEGGAVDRDHRNNNSSNGNKHSNNSSNNGLVSAAPRTRPYANHHVIYKNAREAYLLKPSLKPSAYYGRRPLSKIAKGVTVGTPLVRGFDRDSWDRIHERRSTDKDRKDNKAKKQAAPDPVAVPPGLPLAGPSCMPSASHSSSPSAPHMAQPTLCVACRADADHRQVTDLVLVAHGIGQKFAERVESFHFTHAINAFRVRVNVQLAKRSEARVTGRGGAGKHSIMVLPLNWRHALSFEDGGPAANSSAPPVGFGLKDIEPSTIPAVRSMISDVMFDIPFYMSQHKPKMIKTLVGEANRVYRLWCRNNPDFASHGRVHLMAHSLGSVMAMQILSNQPTVTPPLPLDSNPTSTLASTLIGHKTRHGPSTGGADPDPGPGHGVESGNGLGSSSSGGGRQRDADASQSYSTTDHFQFDTANLFLLGSPVGFFLLLERGQLVPRRGRLKPGADPADVVSSDITGERGQFGCPAVDNVYNVLAKEDPIAYLLNGAIDPMYSSSLKVAHVPSATTGFFQSLGDSIRGLWAGGQRDDAADATDDAADPWPPGSSTCKPPPVARLPSQLELEVHDFTREEAAERKAHLLNDNGQIDYFLPSGGGPLEIQYLNMLSAHSSYWTSQDLVRMLCMEIGRKPGRANTYPNMRAVKIAKRVIPGINQGV